jgi:hypothetical protein
MDDDRRSSENNGEVEVVRERLQRTIDALFEDAALAELWACALNGFAQVSRTIAIRSMSGENVCSPAARGEAPYLEPGKSVCSAVVYANWHTGIGGRSL